MKHFLASGATWFQRTFRRLIRSISWPRASTSPKRLSGGAFGAFPGPGRYTAPEGSQTREDKRRQEKRREEKTREDKRSEDKREDKKRRTQEKTREDKRRQVKRAKTRESEMRGEKTGREKGCSGRDPQPTSKSTREKERSEDKR